MAGLTSVFGETKQSVLGDAFGGATNFMSAKVTIGPSGAALDSGLTNNNDFNVSGPSSSFGSLNI